MSHRRTRSMRRSELWLALASSITFCMLVSCSIAACEHTWYASESAAFVPCATCLALTVHPCEKEIVNCAEKKF